MTLVSMHSLKQMKKTGEQMVSLANDSTIFNFKETLPGTAKTLTIFEGDDQIKFEFSHGDLITLREPRNLPSFHQEIVWGSCATNHTRTGKNGKTIFKGADRLRCRSRLTFPSALRYFSLGPKLRPEHAGQCLSDAPSLSTIGKPGSLILSDCPIGQLREQVSLADLPMKQKDR